MQDPQYVQYVQYKTTFLPQVIDFINIGALCHSITSSEPRSSQREARPGLQCTTIHAACTYKHACMTVSASIYRSNAQRPVHAFRLCWIHVMLSPTQSDEDKINRSFCQHKPCGIRSALIVMQVEWFEPATNRYTGVNCATLCAASYRKHARRICVCLKQLDAVIKKLICCWWRARAATSS